MPSGRLQASIGIRVGRYSAASPRPGATASAGCERVQLPADLTGKRVLDIGAWNGGYSFECERRGAAEVVAYSLENPDVTGFNRLKALLGSRVRYVQGSVYTLSPERVANSTSSCFSACSIICATRCWPWIAFAA